VSLPRTFHKVDPNGIFAILHHFPPASRIVESHFSLLYIGGGRVTWFLLLTTLLAFCHSCSLVLRSFRV
jgi:hypothetical protein